MAAVEQLHFDFLELGHHPLLRRFTPDREGSVLTLPAVMREAQKGECLRLSLTTLLSVQGGEPPKLDQPRLFRM